ncbi:amidase signature enzyme [Thozetella sp. PMI_491]|nr:amidase signature enzyme [Thozetella sp. PMI_491]
MGDNSGLATLKDLTGGLESGCFTSVDLVKAYLARIDEVNDRLHAVIVTNPDAVDIATALDADRASGHIRGPLHGIPILVKDNIATFDKMDNTAGSYALVGAKVPRDSPTVAKLRAGGAVLLGKTNLSQWAAYRASNSTWGWSSVGGQTYGPYYTNQDPYGSSSGSGVASGIGLAFASLGTETHGSIVMPSNRGNVVGIKPTVGLTSRDLVVPISLHQDTVGPIAHNVRDAATILSVIAGTDEHDNYTSAIPNEGVLPDYIRAATRCPNLRGVRIGVPRNGIVSSITFAPVNESYVLGEFEKAIQVLKRLGADIVDPANFSEETKSAYVTALTNDNGTLRLAANNESIALAADFSSNLASYFGELIVNPHNLSSVADLRNFTIHDPREDYPDRDVSSWDFVLSLGFDASDVRAYTAVQNDIALDKSGGVTGTTNRLNLSALIIPTEYAPTWAAPAGLPEVTVPMGAYPDGTPIIHGQRDLIAVAPGIPFGLTFLGQQWSEETLIKLAYAFEQATHHRDKIIPGLNSVLPRTEIVDVLGSSCGA